MRGRTPLGTGSGALNLVRFLAGARLLLGLLLCLCATQLTAQERVERLRVGADEYLRYTLPSAEGPPIDYYISRPSRPAPLLLYIQGSGCTPTFIEMSPGNIASTIFSLTTTAHHGEFAVMVVNKAHAPAERPRPAGLATACPAAFNEHFSLDTWLRRVDAAYRHALNRPWVLPGRSLVIGLSEGATVASNLAAINDHVTDVALVGANGPGQFFDFIVRTYQEKSDDAEVVEGIGELEEQLAKIRAKPLSATDFAWGHPHKRWTSFFRSPSVAALQRTAARIYLVSGMQDSSVPIFSTELLYSQLRLAGRDVTFRRIPTADHGLLEAGSDFQQSIPRLESEYVRITDWFHAGGGGGTGGKH